MDSNNEKFVNHAMAINACLKEQVALGKLGVSRRRLPNRSYRTYPGVSVKRLVKKNYYQEIKDSLHDASELNFVVGATATGKSTFAFTSVFNNPMNRVLMIQPTEANVQSTITEINQSVVPAMQDYYDKHKDERRVDVPNAQYTRLASTSLIPLGSWLVTTATNFVSYLLRTQEIFPFTHILLDEFHLIDQFVITAFLQLLVADVPIKMYFISATPQIKIGGIDIGIQPRLPPGLNRIETDTYGPGPPPEIIKGTAWDPSSYPKIGNRQFAFIVPTESSMDQLAERLKQLGIPDNSIFKITKNPKKGTFSTLKKMKGSSYYAIIHPSVEAGINIFASTFVDCGATFTIAYDGSCVYENFRSLTPSEAIQRTSRCGRAQQSIYITPKGAATVEDHSVADYFYANAVIPCIADGVQPSAFPDIKVFDTYPVLKTLTPKKAAACKDPKFSPFLNLFRYNDEGQLYKTCGGTADGFEDDQLMHCKIYTYGQGKLSGFFISPIADWTNPDFNPDEFIPDRKTAIALSVLMLKQIDPSTSYTFSQLVGFYVKDPMRYVVDLIDQLSDKSRFDDNIPWTVSKPTVSIRTMINSSDLQRLIEATAISTDYHLGVRVGAIDSNGKYPFEFGYEKDGVWVKLGIPNKLLADGTLDVIAAEDEYRKALRDIITVSAIESIAPERVVGLGKYKDKVSKSQTWFTNNVTR